MLIRLKMIESILDNDFYKYSMQQAVMQLFPDAEVEYGFINRGGTEFPKDFDTLLSRQIDNLCNLHLSKKELQYLRYTDDSNIRQLTQPYINFLDNYGFNLWNVNVSQEDGNLGIRIKGNWYKNILWEVPLMSMISELYFNNTPFVESNYDDIQKAKKLSNLKLIDFGTRRRHSYRNHDRVIKIFKEYCNGFVGTSNVHLAMKHDLKPIGTMAHEWIQAHGAMYGFNVANAIALDNWIRVYNGNLGIALTDTYTTGNFLNNFNSFLSRVYDGVRQDSGCPFEIGEQLIQHYRRMGINPKHKTIVFSDSLTPHKAIEIHNKFKDKVNCIFGIGTNLTNDVGVEPLNMVIKMTKFRIDEDAKWIDTVKLSDSPGKVTGDGKMVKLCMDTLGIQDGH